MISAEKAPGSCMLRDSCRCNLFCCLLLSATGSGCNKGVAVGDLAATEVSFENLLKAVAT